MSTDPGVYPVQVRPLSEEEGGGYLATAIDLPGCLGDGETEAEAIADVRNAIKCWIASAKKHGDSIPEPNQLDKYSGKFVARVPKSLHMALVEVARREGVSLNQFVVSKLAEAVGEKRAAV